MSRAPKSQTRQTKELELLRDPWRGVCPNGHTNWASLESGYRCRSCNVYFDRLLDAKDTEQPANPAQ